MSQADPLHPVASPNHKCVTHTPSSTRRALYFREYTTVCAGTLLLLGVSCAEQRAGTAHGGPARCLAASMASRLLLKSVYTHT